MKKQLLLIVFFIGFFNTINAQNDNLEKLLFNLPDVIFKKIETAQGFESAYELKVKQPIDHSDLSKGYFYQKAYLTHSGFDKPTVIITEGYSRNRNRVYELTQLLNANQIDVEHRFFGESMPDSLNYNYLNLKQASADLHHIKQLFSTIYLKKWVSTGISKGGSTTVFYRYFYPNDVDVSVPYVAPINNAFEDQRIYKFLNTTGTDDCRKKIKSFQIRLLKNRDKILPLLKFYSMGAGAKYTYLTLAQAFEYTVLEYPFSFWQYGQDCDKIPNNKASIEDIVTYLTSVSDITFFGDDLIKNYGSHYYQAAAEMGYYGYQTKEFKNLLKALPTFTNPHATFMPNKMTAKFDGTLLKNVNEWIKADAHKMIYINGALDTWSATAVPPNKNVDSEWFFLSGKHHGTARIANMTASEKEKLIVTLEKWLSIKID
ncbi:MAG: hypothetical protein HQ471_09550 [Flavobacteriales bacterium]|nr:hypothetical protein [Flavobacteriales bacterium]